MTPHAMHTLASLTPDSVLPGLAFGMPGGYEWIIVLIIGLLLFGRKLPDVGRWLGQGIVEFKRGIKGIEDDIEDASSSRPERLDDKSAQQPGATSSETSEKSHQNA